MEEKNELAVEPIKKLVWKFAIPSVIAFLVNSLYNIVDQIFVGNYSGYLGNAATSIVFPVFMFGMAIASCIAEGGVAYFSLQQGAGHKKMTEKIFGNVLLLLICFPIFISVVSYIFIDEMLIFFGGTPEIMSLAKDYAVIMIWGAPVWLFGVGVVSFIRADGSPKYAMVSMLVGTVINIILDPIFIYLFDWGIKGAAWATIISELFSFLVVVSYLPRFKAFKIKFGSLKFSFPIVRKIFLYGVSNFLISSAITFVVIANNNSLGFYGALSEYGRNIPISAYALTAKVNQIFISFMAGIGVGMQPIVGYNCGARNYLRVKETFFYCLKSAIFVGVIFSVILESCPQIFVRLFGTGTEEYYKFANISFRIIFASQIFIAIAITCSNFFRAIGKPWLAVFSSGSRFSVFFIPAIYFLPKVFGVFGVLIATPVCEFCSALFALWLLKREMRRFKRLIREEKNRKLLAGVEYP